MKTTERPTLRAEHRSLMDVEIITGIPLARIVATELRKMFDTRSGFWLMTSIVTFAVLASIAVVLFAPDHELTYSSFIAAVGIPTTILLPVIAIVSVTDEWSQRSALVTFTLVPNRGLVLRAKSLASVITALVSVPVVFGVAALGHVAGTSIAGVQSNWDLDAASLLTIGLANLLALVLGFMVGLLVRRTAGAIVCYFVYTFVLPPLTMLLAGSQEWFYKAQPWIDYSYAQAQLFDGSLTDQQWVHLGVTALIWLAAPTVLGLRLVSRAEVK